MAQLRGRDPADLTGKTVLDIGCNGGFYSHRDEAARRGARARHRLRRGLPGAGPLRRRGARARHRVPQALGLRRRRARRALRRRAVHGRALPPAPPAAGARPDPRARRAAICCVFQSMQRGSEGVEPVAEDYRFWQTEHFDEPGYPKLHFIEHRYADDPTNWWVPNRRLRRGDAAQRRLRDRRATRRTRSTSAGAVGAGLPGPCGGLSRATRKRTA